MNKSGYVHRRDFDELLKYEISLESFHLCWKSEQLFEKFLTQNSVKKSKVSDPVYEERGAYLRIPEKRVPRLTSSVDMLKNRSEIQSEFCCVKIGTHKIFQAKKNFIGKTPRKFQKKFLGPPRIWFLE